MFNSKLFRDDKKLNWIFLILIIALSVVFIFYKFNLIPKNLTFDEVEFAKLALSLQNKPFTPYSALATGHSTLYFYILLVSLKTFGINAFALRLPAAIFGLSSVVIFYLLMKRIFQQFLPFLLSLILISSHWFLNFSRFSFEVTFLLFLELVSIYFLISKKSLFVSGLFAGLAFLSYTPGRIFFILPIGFLFLTMKSAFVKTSADKQLNHEIIKRLFIFIIPFIIVITPLTIYLSTHTDTRIDQQFFLMNHEMPINQKISGLWSNISSIGLMFNIKGDINGRHNYPGKPALNPILGVLFIAGLLITMKQWNNDNNKLFLIYFILSLLPALSTYPWENPNMLRTYTALPAIIYFVGNAIIILWTAASKIFLNKKMFISCFLFLVILLSCYYELRTYFKYQPLVFKQSFEIYNSLEKELKVNKKL